MKYRRRTASADGPSEPLLWTVVTELLLICLALMVLSVGGCPLAPGAP